MKELTTTAQTLATTTREAFLKEWALIPAQRSLAKCTSVESCISSNAPSVGEITHYYGIDFSIAYVAMWIVDLRDFVNLKGAMTDSQADLTASLIVRKFNNMNIADIKLVFENAIMGVYGEFYGRLDGQMILSWFTKYFNERCEIAAMMSQNEAYSMQGPSMDDNSRAHKIVENALKSFKK